MKILCEFFLRGTMARIVEDDSGARIVQRLSYLNKWHVVRGEAEGLISVYDSMTCHLPKSHPDTRAGELIPTDGA